MNWKVDGKKADGKAGHLTIVGGPNHEDKVTEHVKGSHPDFTVEKVTALSGSLRATQAAAAEVEATTDAPSAKRHAKN